MSTRRLAIMSIGQPAPGEGCYVARGGGPRSVAVLTASGWVELDPVLDQLRRHAHRQRLAAGRRRLAALAAQLAADRAAAEQAQRQQRLAAGRRRLRHLAIRHLPGRPR